MQIIQGIKDSFIYIKVSIVRILAGSQGKIPVEEPDFFMKNLTKLA